MLNSSRNTSLQYFRDSLSFPLGLGSSNQFGFLMAVPDSLLVPMLLTWSVVTGVMVRPLPLGTAGMTGVTGVGTGADTAGVTTGVPSSFLLIP